MNKKEIIEVLKTDDNQLEDFYMATYKLRKTSIGDKIYLRGLVEASNICIKDCYYCGIRKSNNKTTRYIIPRDELIRLAISVYEKGWSSLVIQTGEQTTEFFVKYIEDIVQEIKKRSSDDFRITLSCGEQTEDTYKRWKDAGADRYLLRFETSSERLYKQYHPNNKDHSFTKRIKAIETLKKLSYQTGTGILIGAPLYSIDILAQDLLFIKKLDVDMVGMGPYVEHKDTPLYERYKDKVPSISERVSLTVKSLAILRNLMPDINMASTTALESLDISAFKKALILSANVFMPNITPYKYRDNYKLYQEKKSIDLESLKNDKNLFNNIAFNDNGDSKHWRKNVKSSI